MGPLGPTGPLGNPGPTGPGFDPVYGGLVQDRGTHTLNVSNPPVPIQFDRNLPSYQIQPVGNSLRIEKSGIYDVEYYLGVVAKCGPFTALELALYENDRILSFTTIRRNVSGLPPMACCNPISRAEFPDQVVELTGRTLVYLRAGSNLTMRLKGFDGQDAIATGQVETTADSSTRLIAIRISYGQHIDENHCEQKCRHCCEQCCN